ncbi:DUF1559 family PulG-like putative transporter [Zavarzinella formosa]|uniref:DUF1559 family PulG-like putative transporter n=1 Tax=Zavarzinella formosa TaxID=360055 RepID=UPI0002F43867|nr:DUF1559 domain-containing protein [Zavarzinella formosa]
MSRPARRGVTLVEVLIALVICVIVIGLLLPAVRRIDGASHRMKCTNNLKLIMLGLHNYSDTNRTDAPSASGLFPPGCFGPGEAPEERLGWMVTMLPYVEQDMLYRQFDLKAGYDGNKAVTETRPKVFLCPASKEFETNGTTYIASAGIGSDAASRPEEAAGNGFMGYDRQTSLAMIKDGTSNTIAILETRSNIGPWAQGGPSTLRGYDPADLPVFGDQRPFGGHSGGFNVAMADGSVTFVRSTVNPARLAGAITINGGESTDINWTAP